MVFFRPRLRIRRIFLTRRALLLGICLLRTRRTEWMFLPRRRSSTRTHDYRFFTGFYGEAYPNSRLGIRLVDEQDIWIGRGKAVKDGGGIEELRIGKAAAFRGAADI